MILRSTTTSCRRSKQMTDTLALVFDLDDTLMDTYGQLVMVAHQNACAAMNRAGLDVPVEELMATRLRLMSEQPRADVNQLLAQHYGSEDPEIIRAGFETYFNPDFTNIEPFPGVHEMLAQLQTEHDLFLVTSGYQKPQQKKVEVLGIGDYFREICYVPVEQADGKREAFKYLQNKYGCDFERMIIIGDRINNEIVHGNYLGCTTVWVRHGECAHILPEGPHEEPNLTLEAIHHLPELLQQLS